MTQDTTSKRYIDNAYETACDATITDIRNGWLAFDRTLFYPTGGGQPHDTGKIRSDSCEWHVDDVKEVDGIVWHHVLDSQGLGNGMSVDMEIDWERRHWFMRLHTASHVLSRLLIDETGVSVSGNSLSFEKARVDFTLDDFDKEYMKTFEEKTNSVLAKDLPVTIDHVSREDAAEEKEVFTLLKELPDSIQRIRIVQVGKDDVVDRSACGGTHVSRTGEVGAVRFLKLENKGKRRRRISFTIENPSSS